MRRFVGIAVAAAALWLITAPSAQAQVTISVPGFTYSSGYPYGGVYGYGYTSPYVGVGYGPAVVAPAPYVYAPRVYTPYVAPRVVTYPYFGYGFGPSVYVGGPRGYMATGRTFIGW